LIYKSKKRYAKTVQRKEIMERYTDWGTKHHSQGALNMILEMWDIETSRRGRDEKQWKRRRFDI